MKKIIPNEERDTILRSWQGADAKIWMFHVSHNRLAITLLRRNEAGALYIVAVGCEYMSGSFSWENSSISLIIGRNSFNEQQCKIVDKNANFEILCSDVILVSGPPGVPDDIFDKFLD